MNDLYFCLQTSDITLAPILTIIRAIQKMSGKLFGLKGRWYYSVNPIRLFFTDNSPENCMDLRVHRSAEFYQTLAADVKMTIPPYWSFVNPDKITRSLSGIVHSQTVSSLFNKLKLFFVSLNQIHTCR